MSDLSLKEQLQPSLLDRLIDHEPQQANESHQRRAATLEEIRDSVIRDLNWLFNVEDLGAVHDLSTFQHIKKSVLNYGVSSVSGRTVGGMGKKDVEVLVRDSIRHFEPRILPETLEVRANLHPDTYSQHAIVLEIVADLWAHPLPIQLFLQTEIDIDSGKVVVKASDNN